MRRSLHTAHGALHPAQRTRASGHGSGVPVYFEAASVITTLVLLDSDFGHVVNGASPRGRGRGAMITPGAPIESVHASPTRNPDAE